MTRLSPAGGGFSALYVKVSGVREEAGRGSPEKEDFFRSWGCAELVRAGEPPEKEESFGSWGWM